MISFLTPLADSGISYAYGFVFVGTNLAAALLVWFFLYESVSLSLENVDLMYSEKGIKPWSSSRWMPPGYTTRKQRDDSHFRKLSKNNRNELRDTGSLPTDSEKDQPMDRDLATESRREVV